VSRRQGRQSACFITEANELISIKFRIAVYTKTCRINSVSDQCKTCSNGKLKWPVCILRDSRLLRRRRFEVLWVATPCSVVVGPCCLHFQGEIRQEVPSKRRYPTATLHSVTTQKTWIYVGLSKATYLTRNVCMTMYRSHSDVQLVCETFSDVISLCLSKYDGE